ncbi:hypothetical protein Tco_0883082 [Tanacetum coccineum]
MADHSRNWYDKATTRERIDSSLDDVDIKKLDENIHVFQVADDEWIRKFIENTDSNIRALKTTTKNLQTTHITPPNDVALATSPILDKHSNEFGEEFSDITRVAEMANGNPAKELSDIIKTYDFETFIRKLLHQVLVARNWNSRSPRLVVMCYGVTLWKVIFKENDKNSAKNDKTEHEMEKSERQSQIKAGNSQSQQKSHPRQKSSQDKGLQGLKMQNITLRDQFCQVPKVIYQGD